MATSSASKISPAAKRSAAGRPNMRDAQKAFTRVRIRDAARDLFHTNGYHGTTLDQIVAAVGASRQTFYLHFESKEAVLSEVLADYLPRLVAQIETMPGPLPSLAEIKAWMLEWVRFVQRERAPIMVLSEIGATAPVQPDFVRDALALSIATFGKRLPAFACAARKSAIGIEARVRAELLIVELTCAGRAALAEEGSAYANTMLAVVAKTLHQLAHDPRYAGHGQGRT